jgi:hypothetical protein
MALPPDANRRVKSEVNKEVAAFSGNFAIDMVDATVGAVRQGFGQASAAQRELAAALSRGSIPANRRKAAHQWIGEQAQRAVVSAYERRRPKRKLPSYRLNPKFPRNRRYAGGALKRALQSSEFFRADERGLSFINETLLTKEARQWRRLNFGAGGGNVAPQKFPVRWGELLLANIGLDPVQVPRVRLPPGRFVAPGSGGARGAAQAAGAPGSGMFYPLGELRSAGPRARMAGGGGGGRRMPSLTIFNAMYVDIQATRFLDSGVRALGMKIGPAYEKLYKEYFQRQAGVAPGGRARLPDPEHLPMTAPKRQRVHAVDWRLRAGGYKFQRSG